MRRQFPTLGRKLAGYFLSKVGEGKNHTLYPQGLSPLVLKMHFSLLCNVCLKKRGFGKLLYES